MSSEKEKEERRLRMLREPPIQSTAADIAPPAPTLMPPGVYSAKLTDVQIHDGVLRMDLKLPNGQEAAFVSKLPEVKSHPATSVVITNLRYVTIRGVRMNCHAVVITDNPNLSDDGGRRYDLTGYGTSCVWHVFDLMLISARYSWKPDEARGGFPPQRGNLVVDAVDGTAFAMHHETVVQLSVENHDLGIIFETIEGSWTPGQIDHTDWAEYNQRVGIRVFDQACKAVEALSYKRNIILPIATLPETARVLFDEDGSSLRRKP